MSGKTEASISVIIAIALVLTIPLSVVGNPFLIIVNAESATSSNDTLTSSNGNGDTTAGGAGTTTGEAIPTDDTTAGGAGTATGGAETTDEGAGTTAGGARTAAGGAETTDEGAGTTTGEAIPTDDTTAGGAGPTAGEAIPTDDTTAGGAGTAAGGAGTATNSSANDLNTGVNSTGTGSSVSGLPPGSAGALGGAKPGVSNQSSTSRTHTEVTGDNSLPTTSSSESAISSSSELAISSSAENSNSVQKPISGDGQTVVAVGDVSENHGTSAKISTDKKSYAPGDSAVITVQDPDADVDDSVINTVTIVLGSSIDDPNGSTITLTETARDSGIFVGTTTVPTAGDNFRINYDSSHPQAQAVINGVHGGSVEVSELPVSSFEQVLGIGFGQPAVVVGNGIQVTYLDGADPELSSECESRGFLPGMGCGGNTQITISYANAPADLNGLPPGSLTIWQFVPLIGWIDLGASGNIQRHPETKTITATSPYGPGVYVIGSPDEGGAGGGSGGVGFPGAGVVLDLVAPIVAATPEGPAQPPSDQRESVETPSSLKSISAFSAGETTGLLQRQANIASEGTSASLGAQQSTPVSLGADGSFNSFNTTIAVPGVGNVILSFSNLGSQRAFVVSAVKPSEASSMKTINLHNGAAAVLTLNKTRYNLVGPILSISPVDLKLAGSVTVVIPYNSTIAPNSGEDIRILGYTGSSWVDMTTKPPANGHTVTGSLTSLGPVVAAVKSPQA